MATFGIRTLTIEIRDIAAQLVGFGNATPLATHFAINPHHAPFLIEIKPVFCHIRHCLFIQRCPLFPENRPRGNEGVPHC